MANVTFNVQCTMDERWVDAFCSMLNQMELWGRLGHSNVVGFYADGDGDFRPTFTTDQPYTKRGDTWMKFLREDQKPPMPEVVYDAGSYDF